MATRTITVDQYADDGTTTEGSGGDVLTVNGGTITFRRDSRRADGVNATLGGNSVISATLGGGIVFDGTKVRWLPVSSSSGSASIGTTITQGGVSGSFLGFFSSLTARGSTTLSGAGFIKFREVTGGAFSAGALSGVTAIAAGSDVTGWIEIVADQSANFNIPRLGKFQVKGDWFYLDNTTGTDGQNIQTPTNGSSVTYAPGLWIETSPGSGTYEFYSAVYAAAFISANFGNDARSKVVKMGTTGILQIGDGTGVGYVPPSGCKVRIPNVIMRQCVTTTRQTNAIPHTTVATRPDFTTTNAGVIDIQYSYNDWYLLFAQPFAVTIKHTATHDGINVSECASPLDIDDGGAGSSAGLALAGGYFTSCFAGGTINNWIFSGISNALTGGICSFAYCIGQRVTNCKSGVWTYARSATKSFGFYTSQCTDIQFNNCQTLNCTNELLTSFQMEVNNFDYCDRYVGTTNTTTGLYCWIVTASCDTVKIDGITFGLGGTIANQHPYNGIISYLASSNLKFRNFGTRASFLNGGSANNPAYICADGGNNLNVKIQRCYMQPTRTGALSSQNSSKNMLFEDVYGDWADAQTQAGLNLIVRGGGGTNSVTGQASVYGTHFGGSFQSDTAGRMWLALNEPTSDTLQYTSRSFSVGSGFTSAGGLSLATAGDYFICEMQEYRLQTTGFENAAATITATNAANHDFEYQIDTGSGWNGTWKTLNGVNLSGETILPSVGYKLKFKITCNTSNNSNLVSYVRCNTTSTYAAQVGNLYPLDSNTITFTGLPTGCDTVVLSAGTTTVLDSKDQINGTSYAYNYSGAQTVDVGFIKPGYVPFYIRGLSLVTADSTIPVALTPDRNYT